jgi:endonuclease/exonuclease/phosphatase family metal-dependent hydrolase
MGSRVSAQRAAAIAVLGLTSVCGIAACGRGEVSVLTYNVAGLPERLSASHPAQNSDEIGTLLNDYDVAVLQEDFAYHAELRKNALHPYGMPAIGSDGRHNASGLARLSNLPMTDYQQWIWDACHGTTGSGSDCLATKGFSVAAHQVDLVASSVQIDIYNLHMDAGDSAADDVARQRQIGQLLETIAAHSLEKAVIVAGDTNVELLWDGPLTSLMNAGFEDACSHLDCPEPDRIDRVLYRSSAFITLEPQRWRVPEGFTDEEGRPLSDHRPVVVEFSVIAGGKSWRPWGE